MAGDPRPGAQSSVIAPWEARFRAHRILWVRMAAERPDRAIACSNVSGVYQIHRWQVGEAVGEAMTAFPTGKGAAWISPDGAWVVWHADRAGDEVGHFVAAPWEGGEPIDLTPALPGYASFAAGFGTDGTFGCSIIGSDRVQLAVVPFPPGAEAPRLLDPGPGFVTGMAVGPAGTVAYSTTAGRGLQTVLRVIDGSTGELRLELDHAPGAVRVLEYAPTGRLIGSTTRSGMQRPLIVEPDGSVRDFRLPDEPGELWPVSISHDGRTALLIGAHRTVERLVLLDVDTGTARTVAGIEGDLIGWGGAGTFLRPDGRIVVTREDATMLPEVLLVDPADGAVLDTLIPTTPLPASRPLRSIDVPTTGGFTCQGWLMTPDGPGPFPTILDIHGGPQGHETDRFNPDAQAWVDRGFATSPSTTAARPGSGGSTSRRSGGTSAGSSWPTWSPPARRSSGPASPIPRASSCRAGRTAAT
jgi:hypothetical protein